MKEANEGIAVTGGQVVAGQMVAGRHARAYATINGTVGTLRNDGHDEVALALDRLVMELRQHADTLDDFEEILDSTRAVSEELAREKPNKRIITSLLAGISEGVTSVASLATAVTSLMATVATVL
jgi:hypothetical protein